EAETTTDLDKYLTYPEGNPTVWGPKGWDYFEDVANSIPCQDCRKDAQNFVTAFHDLVNIKTGKEVYNPSNLLRVKNEFDRTVQICHKKGQCSSSKLRPCKGIKKRKLEHCISEVKEKGHGVNPYAVCKAYLKCK